MTQVQPIKQNADANQWGFWQEQHAKEHTILKTLTAQLPLTPSGTGMVLQGQTQAEKNANVTPINYQYAPGWIPRYMTASQLSDWIAATHLVDQSSAITNAIAANDYVRAPGPGPYFVNSQINVNRGHLTIEGDNRGTYPGGVATGGTTFLLGTGAGTGAALFNWNTSLYQSIVLKHFGIQLNNPGKQQIGIRMGQVIGCRIEDLFIQGQGTTSDDTYAIQLDGAGTYTGDFLIFDCYLANHLTAIRLGTVASPSITTLKIINTDFNGTAGHTTSCGIRYGYAGATSNGLLFGALVSGCNFLQISRSIDSYGEGLRQIGNYHEPDAAGNPTGVITTFGAITGGAAYTNGTYLQVPLTGGSGFSGLVNITVAGGAVTACALVFGGMGYTNTDVVSVAAANIGGTGSGFSIPVSAVGTGSPQAWVWTRGAGVASMQNMAIGEFRNGPGYVTPVNGVDSCVVITQHNYLFDNGFIESATGFKSDAGGLGLYGQPIAAQVTGWGTPTGGSVVANFPGATATLAQTSAALAELLTILKARGDIGA